MLYNNAQRHGTYRLWLRCPGGEEKPLEPDLSDLPAEVGKIHLKKRVLPEGILILDSEAEINVPTSIRFHMQQERTLAFWIHLSGSETNVSPHFEGESKINKHQYLINMSPSIDAVSSCSSGQSFSSLAVFVPISAIESVYSQHHLSKAIADFMYKGRSFRATPPLFRQLRSLVSEIKACPFEGPMELLLLRGLVMQLLSNTMPDLDLQHGRNSISLEHRKIAEARSIILSEMEHPPSITDLAARLGVSQKKLTRLFQNAYGKSAFECLGEWRMEVGCELLLESDLPIKEIASRLGYNHANNFINAFTNNIGVPPAHYRRKKLCD